jgi:DNA helicase-2/ATP-dependent DNA helicase PcrA
VSGFGAKRKESIAYLNVMLHKLLKGYSKYMTQTINMQEYFKECIEVILEFKDIKKENNAAFSVIEENLNSLTTILLEMEGDLEERINTFLIEYSGENVKDDRDHVLGLTIHKAKGCENKVCFILDFQDFPARFSENTEEETRVLYVAVTRAMEKLYITGVTLETPFFKIFEKFDYLATNLSKEILENAGKVYADRQG